MCFSVSLICFTSCAAAAPGSNRARARSVENNAPRNPRRVDTAYPFRMSDMAWSSISTHHLHPQFWPRHDGNRTITSVVQLREGGLIDLSGLVHNLNCGSYRSQVAYT